MRIKRIVARNYKTYRELDLNIEVEKDRPIILIGGANGCGKTTLFDAIYHARKENGTLTDRPVLVKTIVSSDMANVMAVDKRGDSISIVTELGVFDIEKGLYPRDYEDIYNSIKEGDEIDIDLETSEKTIVINGKIYKF